MIVRPTTAGLVVLLVIDSLRAESVLFSLMSKVDVIVPFAVLPGFAKVLTCFLYTAAIQLFVGA